MLICIVKEWMADVDLATEDLLYGQGSAEVDARKSGASRQVGCFCPDRSGLLLSERHPRMRKEVRRCLSVSEAGSKM